MKHITTLIFAITLTVVACKDDDKSITYPSLYTYSHTEIVDGRFYVLDINGEFVPVATPGDYVEFIDTLDQFIDQSTREFLFFEEFELLSETMIRFKVQVDQTPFDTTVMYAIQDEELLIDGIDPAFVRFDADADEFHVCAYAQLGIRGPNPPISGVGYGILIGTCEYDYAGHLADILDQDIYVSGDTVGFYTVNTVYQKD